MPNFFPAGACSLLSALGDNPFYRHLRRCRKYQWEPDFYIFQIDGFENLRTHGFILLLQKA
ncbi:hypothetical protein DPMN_020936 [Dreissena polymorpha]|uniref:Uncharacterized protein n=1 Tax=Dreissena polymorpha TaxID=45954 RepID=A0A9D4NM31_DREPO|nr:hypothetical protein DPMN_020936 [Dreissena polymorpha]